MVSTIKSFGEQSYLTNTILLKEFIGKLPTSLRMSWLRESAKSKPNLEDFAKWLNQEADYLAAGSTYPSHPSSDSESEPKSDSKSTPQKYPKQREKKCFYCSISGHRTQECWKFKTECLSARLQLAHNEKLCHGCLNPGHTIHQCRSKKVCPIERCGLHHHHLLHESAEL